MMFILNEELLMLRIKELEKEVRRLKNQNRKLKDDSYTNYINAKKSSYNWR